MSKHEILSFRDPIAVEKAIEDEEGRWSCSTKIGGQFTVSPTKLGLAEGGAALYYSVSYPHLHEFLFLFFEEAFLPEEAIDIRGDKYGVWPVDLDWEGTHETHQIINDFSVDHSFSFDKEHLVLHKLLERGHSSLTIGLEVRPHKRDLTAIFNLEDFADRIRKARDLCHFHP